MDRDRFAHKRGVRHDDANEEEQMANASRFPRAERVYLLLA